MGARGPVWPWFFAMARTRASSSAGPSPDRQSVLPGCNRANLTQGSSATRSGWTSHSATGLAKSVLMASQAVWKSPTAATSRSLPWIAASWLQARRKCSQRTRYLPALRTRSFRGAAPGCDSRAWQHIWCKAWLGWRRHEPGQNLPISLARSTVLPEEYLRVSNRDGWSFVSDSMPLQAKSTSSKI